MIWRRRAVENHGSSPRELGFFLLPQQIYVSHGIALEQALNPPRI